jgi:hypothetical protein
MDSESSNHYRGRKRKTGGRGRQKAEEAEAVPFQADVLVALPIVHVAAGLFRVSKAQAQQSPWSSPWIIGKVANIPPSLNCGLTSSH